MSATFKTENLIEWIVEMHKEYYMRMNTQFDKGSELQATFYRGHVDCLKEVLEKIYELEYNYSIKP